MYYFIGIIRVFTVCIIVLGRIKRWREYNPILERKAPAARGMERVDHHRVEERGVHRREREHHGDREAPVSGSLDASERERKGEHGGCHVAFAVRRRKYRGSLLVVVGSEPSYET